jgi:formylglycine-generating enzyme required for sulfatase activity
MYEVKSGFDVKKLAAFAREAVEKHDVRHISTLHTRDGQTCEIWYYGRTKVHRDDIVLRISILTGHSRMELFAATRSAEALTGLLAEVGRDLKQIVEDRISGRGRVVNVHIKDSPVQRSNLLDLCDMDGNCDVNVVVEGSVVQHSNVATANEDARRKGEEEKREEAERLRREQEERRKREEQRKAQEAERLQAEEAEKKRKAEEERKAQEAERRKAAEEQQKAAERRRREEAGERQRKAEQEARSRETARQPYAPATPEKQQFGNSFLTLAILVLLVGGLWWGLSGSTDNNDVTDLQVPDDSTQDSPETYTNSIGMEFVKIPPGEFEMGSPSDEEGRWDEEGPIHEVTIEKAYYLGTYEVTQEQWVEVMGNNPSEFEGDNNPVESVSWDDVQEFVEKLNELEGTDKYRLPSEAEWEYACRAGTTTRYSFGDGESDLGDYAWYSGYKTYEEWEKNMDEILKEGSAHPVGQKKPNPWGLYDMHGNVCEWCQDEWHDSYDGAPADGSAWEDGSSSSRVIRGGNWILNAGYCRSAARNGLDPDIRYFYLGFRLLRAV